jgi:hypothetical protein
MKATTKKRLCWNCEGNVPLNLENCPYCSVYLNPSSRDDSKDEEEDLAPPYRLVTSSEDQKVPASPFSNLEPENPKDENIKATGNIADASATLNDVKIVAMPLTLLLAGSIFFLFSLLMLLFSERGLLTLQWNGSYWYVYLIIALPMLFFGWKSLRNVDEENDKR